MWVSMDALKFDGSAQGRPTSVLQHKQIDVPEQLRDGRWVRTLGLALFAGLLISPWTMAGAVAPAEPSAQVVHGGQGAAIADIAHHRRFAEADAADRTFGFDGSSMRSPLISAKIANQIAKLEKAVHVNPRNASAWNNLGHLRLRTGDVEGAKRAYHSVLKLGLYHGNREVQAAAYANLGIVYKSSGDLDRAKVAHQKALKLNTRIGRRDRMADAYINLGVIHQAKGDYDEAIDAQLKALTINKQLGNRAGMANAYGNLGVIYKLTGDLLKAETSLTSSLTIKEHLGDQEGVAKAHANLGSIYQSRGNIGEACRLWSRAYNEFTAVNHRQWANVVRSWMSEANCRR